MYHIKLKAGILLLAIIIFSAVLRIVWLGNFPASLYTDEADQGYNAYSILLTGRDEHGVFLPVSMRSFGDWKPPLPTYLMIPFIYFSDLNSVAIRMPSALSGVGTIVLTYLLVVELFSRQKYKTKIALLSAFFLSISPWHILQSRSAMLVVISLFFLEAGVLFFLWYRKKASMLIFSAIFFSLSIYAYYGMRVITPLVILLMYLRERKNIVLLSKEVIVGFLAGIIILIPLFAGIVKNKDVLLGRAQTVSVFYDQGVKLLQWEYIAQDGVKQVSPTITRLFHNNVTMYVQNIIRRYLSHFDGDYLFFTGDKAEPFEIPNMGILYIPDGIFILAGIILLIKRGYKGIDLLLGFLLISFIPAAFTFMTPSTNRTFNAVVPLVIFSSGCAVYLSSLMNKSIIPGLAISLVYTVLFAYFMQQYFLVLPKKHSDWWNWGWKQVVNYVSGVDSRYNNVIVADVNGMPYIYFLFYTKYNPALYQKQAVRPYVPDRFGFEHVEGFGKFWFPKNFEWKYVKNDLQKDTLYVVPADQAPGNDGYIKEIDNPAGKPLFKIFSSL
ncbi:phospholipid carrier-dependent glycosyltransferase [Patescibacteria group bacterium]|nr:phospholipid carrier-dependent glycosyltransferase [Patescibacteria group bacterium]MCL5798010.1 phospholipid carrier-dependent glycosyltransferase [Patescibacteria group bacterium]